MSHLGNVLNKARLFDDNLANHPISAAKIIPILTDFAEKMEELLNNMRSLFDELGPEGNQEVPLENVLDISLETSNIPSLTGWRWEAAPTKTPLKSDQPGPSKWTRKTEEEEPQHQLGSKSTPQQQATKEVTIMREIQVDDMAKGLLEEIQVQRDQLSQLEIPQQPARIDMVQIGPNEQPAKQRRELLTPPETSTLEPATVTMSLPHFM